MKKPIIGVTMNHFLTGSGHEFDNVGFSRQEWTTGADDYANFVEKAGGIPVLMPFYLDQKNIKDFVGLLDGLLITGGDDVGPYLNGEDLIKESALINYKRDTQEVALMKYVFEKTDIPVLGVCRGMQLINVAMGGTLVQDIPSERPSDIKHRNSPDLHDIDIMPHTRSAQVMGQARLRVNSSHHQCVRDVAPALKVTAYSPDGIPEMLEGYPRLRIMAAQYHPEVMAAEQNDSVMLRFFQFLVEESRR